MPTENPCHLPPETTLSDKVSINPGGATVLALAESPRAAAHQFGQWGDDLVVSTADLADGETVGLHVHVVAVAGDAAVSAGLDWALHRLQQNRALTVVLQLPRDEHARARARSRMEAAGEQVGARRTVANDGYVILSAQDVPVSLLDNAGYSARQREVAATWVNALAGSLRIDTESAVSRASERDPAPERVTSGPRAVARALGRAGNTLGIRINTRVGLIICVGLLLSLFSVVLVGQVLGRAALLIGLFSWVMLLLVSAFASMSSAARSDLEQLRREVAKQKRMVTKLAKQETDARTEGLAEILERGPLTQADVPLLTERMRAISHLAALATPKGPIRPSDADVSPEILLQLVSLLLSRCPAKVLMCGVELSTVYLALAAKQHGLSCHIIALDEDRGRVLRIRDLVHQQGVGHLVDVRHAALEPVKAGSSFGASWYTPAALEPVVDLDLVIVNGPPVAAGPLSRFSLVTQLGHLFADDCLVVVTDVSRPDEHSSAGTWAEVLSEFDDYEVPGAKGDLVAFEKRRTMHTESPPP